MGSDHAASDDKSGWIIARKEPKCFKVGQYGVAFTDSFRMGQILQYGWTPPKYTPTKTNSGLDKFMRTKFIESVKDAFRAGGYGIQVSGQEDEGGVFLIGVEGRIFTIDEDFHVGEAVVNYMAEGSGAFFAMGALYATRNQKNPKMRIKVALEAASEFSMSVAPPFTYIQV